MRKTWQQQQAEISAKNAQRKKHLTHLAKLAERSQLYGRRYPDVCQNVIAWAHVQNHSLSSSTEQNLFV